MIWRLGWLALMTIFAAQTARAEPCARDSYEGAEYIICSVDPAASDLRLFWQDSQGTPFRSFDNLVRSVEEGSRRLTFAINAGMYRTDFSPVGLYVENGRELRPPDKTTIDRPPREVPNFYKKPNGVFFLLEKRAGILTTDEFLKGRPDARFATQSGPMLVIRGALHSAFIPYSTDRTRRSGVGVCEGGQVRFAISEGGVNFHEFARLFRDRLACPNALFLDGGHGVGLYSPSLQRNDASWHGGYGPILGVIE
ncbi:phosphodiester glycosidase family protein [Aureimonas psammosilenae]|uniref:phosphodiester glycosidase family protein n=1 Tax=Aureimonas psammosilenae TaxID=2495496 RepID=UPI0012604B03|nr:phosphodiester glycosidase family protein [Aureimonas psammosilenae]